VNPEQSNAFALARGIDVVLLVDVEQGQFGYVGVGADGRDEMRLA